MTGNTDHIEAAPRKKRHKFIILKYFGDAVFRKILIFEFFTKSGPCWQFSGGFFTIRNWVTPSTFLKIAYRVEEMYEIN